MHDDFYFLKYNSVKKVKNILIWAKNNARTYMVHMRIPGDPARKLADKSFEEVLGLISKESLPYFRIIYRKQQNLFGILYDDLVIEDILEIGICGIDVGTTEYYIFIYLT